LTLLLLFAK